MPGAEIISKNPLHLRNPRYDFYPNLDLVPAQMELDDTEIEMASTTTGSPMLSEWQKRTLLCEWIDKVGANDSYDFIVFDCPPATKLVSQNALAASDFFLIPVIPDVMSSRGVTHFRNLVTVKIDQKLQFLVSVAGVAAAEVPRSFVRDTKMAGIVASMAKVAGNAASGLTNVHTEQLAVLRRQWGDDLLVSVVKHMTGVQEAIDAGYPAWNIVQDQNLERVTPMLEEVCREIASRIT
jgi:chromosome partitioning protein